MGNCESLSETATASVGTKYGVESNGSEEAAMIYNNGVVSGSKVVLSYECKNLPNMDVLSKSDPFIVIYLQNDVGEWKEIGRTEIVVNNLNPVFVKKTIVHYKFECVQNLKFSVYDADESSKAEDIKLDRQDFIGETICALSSIVHKNTATILDLKLNNKIRGQITIKCEELGEANGIIRGCFKGLNLSKKSFYRIFNIDEKNGSTPMYKSEVAKHGGWNAFEIHSQLFCNGDLFRPIIIKVYEYKQNGSHIEIGTVSTNTKELLDGGKRTVLMKGDRAYGSLQVENFTFTEKPTFLQFICNGLQVNFMTAIDFTSSNGFPTNPSSLHYYNKSSFSQGRFNPYEEAIHNVGSVLEFYDDDKLFPCYGFGACLDNQRIASHSFPLNRNEVNPNVSGIDGIMNIYHQTLNSVLFSGPTLFGSILEKANGFAREIKPEMNKYLVLLIITDGAIHDMDIAIQQIVYGADLPLSILIVGVGNGDFKNMNILDGDEERLRYEDKLTSRDIVQFVAMNEMKSKTPEEIARALLEEIPRQVEDYMEQNGITVETLRERVPFAVQM